jgi:glycosyltransferase involved in cell wall biosynthesis
MNYPPRLNIACITPLNPMPTGLSDYGEMLLPALAEHVDLTLYSDCGVPSNQAIAARFDVRPVQQLLRNHHEHDLRLYQIGNSNHHASAFDMLRCLPGVVTLHEPFLHIGFRNSTRSRYERELSYELGYLSQAEKSYWLSEENRERLLAQAPLIGRVVDSSLGIIVHSQYARAKVRTGLDQRERAGPPEVAVIPHLMPLLPTGTHQAYRPEFGLPADRLIVGVIGIIAPLKEPDLILQAMAQACTVRPDLQLVFAGECPPLYSLDSSVEQLGLTDRVVFLGRIDPLERLHRAMLACDIIIVLRRPTIGETSGIALRTLALGRPLIVRNVGWFSELPAEAVLKLNPADGVEALAHALLDLAEAPDRRERMGDAGRHYIQTECDVAVAARRYANFLQATWQRVVKGI